MNTYFAVSLALLLLPVRWIERAPTPSRPQQTQPRSRAKRVLTPQDLTRASESELMQHLGENVTLRGKFSLRGKVGPFILVRGRPIYFQSKVSFDWGERYTRMEGRTVRATGTLRFVHYPTPPPQALPEARPYDHFYFEAETAKVELFKR